VKNGKSPPFVMLYHSIFDSDEYASLTSVARDILWLLIRRYNGRNNGGIPLGCREAATWAHCGVTTAHSALKDLVNAGFITVKDKGRLVRSGDNRASRYHLNFKLPTKD
jgi:hypothetical protein